MSASASASASSSSVPAPLNSEWILSVRPSGLPDSSTFVLRSCSYPTLLSGSGSLVLRTLVVSVDPYLRGLIKSSPLQQPIVSGLVGEVMATDSSDYAVGDIVQYYSGWRLYNVITPSATTVVRKVNKEWGPISTAVGVLGMPAQTAYFGLFNVASFQPTDVVLVSAAAGAVGSIVVQLAKWKGATVIATAGGADKCAYVKSLGADETVDYKKFHTCELMSAELKRVAPKGVDIYFDNTGGHVTDAVWPLLNRFARVAVCGAISMYNDVTPPPHPNFLSQLIYKSITVRGFLVNDFSAEFDRFFAEMPKLVQQGTIKYTETVLNGFEQVPTAFIGLFKGANTGKALVKIE